VPFGTICRTQTPDRASPRQFMYKESMAMAVIC
jgi:hypothetical protein